MFLTFKSTETRFSNCRHSTKRITREFHSRYRNIQHLGTSWNSKGYVGTEIVTSQSIVNPESCGWSKIVNPSYKFTLLHVIRPTTRVEKLEAVLKGGLRVRFFSTLLNKFRIYYISFIVYYQFLNNSRPTCVITIANVLFIKDFLNVIFNILNSFTYDLNLLRYALLMSYICVSGHFVDYILYAI